MIVMGIICILMGIFGIWMANGWYREATTDLPSFKSTKYVEHSNFLTTIGIIASLIGVIFIIFNFTII